MDRLRVLLDNKFLTYEDKEAISIHLRAIELLAESRADVVKSALETAEYELHEEERARLKRTIGGSI